MQYTIPLKRKKNRCYKMCFLVKAAASGGKQVHSNSPNLGALGPGTARNSEMSVSGNSQSSTSLYIVSYRHKLLLLYMYMYTTIKNTSSVTILWKILCNFVA